MTWSLEHALAFTALLFLGVPAVVVTVIVVVLKLTGKRPYTKDEAAADLEAFVEGRGGPWDWDDFTSTTKDDPDIEEVRLRCCEIDADFPPTEPGRLCSAEGYEVIRKLAAELREKAAAERAARG